MLPQKISNILEYYQKHGLWSSLVYSLERVGVVFRNRSLIFFERPLSKIRQQPPIAQEASLVNLTATDIMRDGYQGGWLTYDEALQWLQKRGTQLLALKLDNNTLVCSQWIESNTVDFSFFDLMLSIPENIAYLSHLYTPPEFRGKGYASITVSHILAYLQQQGYQKAFIVIVPENKASRKVYEKSGFKAYQTVTYRKFWFLGYYSVKEYQSSRKTIYWSGKKAASELWKSFPAQQ